MRQRDAWDALDALQKPILMPKSARRALLSRLEELLRHAKMEHCNFSEKTPDGHPFGKDCTDYVREVTRVWRQTWIIPQLEHLIKAFDEGTLPPLTDTDSPNTPAGSA